MLLDKKSILDASDLKTVDVDVPEWGGTVRLAVMSGEARDKYENSIHVFDDLGNPVKKDLSNLRAKLVAACLVDESGDLLFDVGEVKLLGRKSNAALDRLYFEAVRLNRFAESDVEASAKN